MQRDDAVGVLAHLLPLEPQADKLPPELRGQFYRALGQAYHTSRPRPDVAWADQILDALPQC